MSALEPEQSIIGQIIAERWQIAEFLGEGLMSYVYKAKDTETGKIIVLKLIKNKQNLLDIPAIENQAKGFVALNHENIGSYYNVHQTSDGRLFLFCDYLEGETFASLLAKKTKIPIDESIEIFKQIIDGLIAAHKNQIWHGDLRPSNIFIVNDQFSTDEAKIVDFGIMNLVDNQLGKLNQATTHQAFAFAPYISPEQRLGHKVDQCSDLYTFGCLMYEALAGKPPFVGNTAMVTAYKQKQQTTTALHEIVPPHPLLSRYQDIVNKLIKADRNERYQSAAAVKADLDLIPNVTDITWSKKAGAFKQSTYSILLTKRWQICAAAAALALLLFLIVQIVSIVGLYFQPWTGISGFNDNKLWVVQEKRAPSPSSNLLKEKTQLLNKLNILKNNKQANTDEYAQTLFTYSSVLSRCGHWQESQNTLLELQKLSSKLIRPADILASIAYTYYLLSNVPAAIDYCKQAQTAMGNDAAYSSDKIVILKILGDIANSSSDNKQALTIYEQLHELATQVRMRDPSGYAYACALLADAYRKDEQYEKSEKIYKDAVDWGINFIGQRQLFMAKAYYGLALTQYHRNELKAAAQQLQQAFPIAVAHQGKQSNFVIAIKKFYDYLLFHQNLLIWAKSHWQ